MHFLFPHQSNSAHKPRNHSFAKALLKGVVRPFRTIPIQKRSSPVLRAMLALILREIARAHAWRLSVGGNRTYCGRCLVGGGVQCGF